MSNDSSTQSGRRRWSLILGVVLGVTAMEAATVFVVIYLTHASTEGASVADIAPASADHVQWVEMPLIAEKFQNSRTGVSYIYDADIFILVRTEDEPVVTARVEAEKAQICRDIGTIFRRAEPHHLNEGELRTITRQIEIAINQQLGVRPDDGQPMVREVIVKKCMRYRTDI